MRMPKRRLNFVTRDDNFEVALSADRPIILFPPSCVPKLSEVEKSMFE